MYKAHERQDDNGYDAHEDSKSGNSLIAAAHVVHHRQVLRPVSRKAAGHDGIQEAVTNLHNARREPENQNLAHVRETELHEAAIDLDRG